MKKLFKPLFAVSLLLLAVLCLSACGGEWDAPYPDLDKQGYTVSVKFDANGGQFATLDDVTMIDVFNPENAPTNANGEKEITLLAPNDERRGTANAFEISKVLQSDGNTTEKFIFAGWYEERTPRVDENGAPLDDYGVLTSVSGKPQGYVYADRWDFENDVLTIDPNETTSSSTPVMTLYAAWVPYFNYEFYALDAETGETTLQGTLNAISLTLPEWGETSGKMEMGSFPTRDGMTFDKAYLDAAMTQPLTEKTFTAEIDYETGLAVSNTVKVYTTWTEGVWFKISTAKQFIDNSRIDGCYEILADLDFTGLTWNLGLSKGLFTGTILGNGHTFSNISCTQVDNAQTRGGIFGAIGDSAKIENLAFESITYTLAAGSRTPSPTFGLLAGTIAEGAALENVTVSGSLIISDAVFESDSYQIGLLSGDLNTRGIDVSGITCEVSRKDPAVIKLTAEVKEDGSVILSFVKPDSDKDSAS